MIHLDLYLTILYPLDIELKVQSDAVGNHVCSLFFCWGLWHGGESAGDDGSDAGLKEVAGVDVSVHGEGLAQSSGLASIGSCNI